MVLLYRESEWVSEWTNVEDKNLDLRSVIPNDHHHQWHQRHKGMWHQNVTTSPTRNLLRLTLRWLLCVASRLDDNTCLKCFKMRQTLSCWIELLFPPIVLLSCSRLMSRIPSTTWQELKRSTVSTHCLGCSSTRPISHFCSPGSHSRWCRSCQTHSWPLLWQ